MLINRNFALFWSGQIISKIGDSLFLTVLVLWISLEVVPAQSWKPLAVTGVFLSAALPIIAFGPVAGVFADRWESRRILLIANALSTLLTLALLFTKYLPLFWQLSTIYAMICGLAICGRFFDPSAYKLINDIVSRTERARASGLRTVLVSMGAITGPVLATLLFFTVGVYSAILFNALSFLVSFFTILAIRPPILPIEDAEIEKLSFWQDFIEGLRFLVQSRVLTTILIACILDVAYEGVFNSLGIFYVVQNLSMPPSFYGLLNTGLGIGLALGSLLATTLASRLNVVRTFWVALFTEGVAIFICSRLNNPLFTIITLTFAGGAVAFINIATAPIILHVTPRKFLGRIYAALNPILTLSLAFSAILASYLDSTSLRNFHATFFYLSFSLIDTLLSITGLLAIMGGIYARAMLRDVKMTAGSM